MSTDLIFYTQVASIIALLVAVFVLYRVLLAHRNSTMALLLDRDRSLSIQLAQLTIRLSKAITENAPRRNDAPLDNGTASSADDKENVQLKSQILLEESQRLLDEASKRSSLAGSRVSPIDY